MSTISTRCLAACVAVIVLSHRGDAQATDAHSIGTWRGTSSCLVRPSVCNDEIVVYRITTMNATDSVAIDARKLVGGQEQEMGVLGCRLTPATGQLTCTIPQGTWHFRANGDSLSGELRLVDNTRFREVRTARVIAPSLGTGSPYPTNDSPLTLSSGTVVRQRNLTVFRGNNISALTVTIETPTPASDTVRIADEAHEIATLHDQYARSLSIDRITIAICRSHACVEMRELPEEMFHFTRADNGTWRAEKAP